MHSFSSFSLQQAERLRIEKQDLQERWKRVQDALKYSRFVWGFVFVWNVVFERHGFRRSSLVVLPTILVPVPVYLVRPCFLAVCLFSLPFVLILRRHFLACCGFR